MGSTFETCGMYPPLQIYEGVYIPHIPKVSPLDDYRLTTGHTFYMVNVSLVKSSKQETFSAVLCREAVTEKPSPLYLPFPPKKSNFSFWHYFLANLKPHSILKAVARIFSCSHFIQCRTPHRENFTIVKSGCGISF